MSKTTTNLGLVKPELTDAADITAMNQNWDILDTTVVAKFVVTIENPVSANTLIENGFYRCYFDDSTHENYNFPCKYGSLWVLGSSSYKAQLCLDVLNNVYYFRTTSNASTWKEWKRIITNVEQGTKGQFLGFTDNNKLGTLDLPSAKDYMFREIIKADNLKASESLRDVGTYQIYLENIDPATYNYPNKYGMFTVERGTSYFKQTFYDMVGKVIYYRSSVDTGTTWTEWRMIYDIANKPTPAEIGAAPSGYGLGEENGKVCTDCNTAIIPGFYALSGATCKNAPDYGELKYGSMIVERRYESVFQTVTFRTSSAKRYSVNSGETWEAWEYVNPPLEAGVEYRTTERYMGLPVYVKLTGSVLLTPNSTRSISYYDDGGLRYATPVSVQPLYTAFPDGGEIENVAGVPPFVEKVWAGANEFGYGNYVNFTSNDYANSGYNGLGDAGEEPASVSAIVKYVKVAIV